jgi:hypothetical protein
MRSDNETKAIREWNSTPVSITPPSDSTIRRAIRVLSMVGELHKAGYQQLRIAAGMSPSGIHWRCHITPAVNVQTNGWEPIDWNSGVANYSSSDGSSYFGWTDAPSKNARELAQLFLERFSDIARLGVGSDYEYAGWFVRVLGCAENGDLPIFFSDDDADRGKILPPPLIRR